MKDIDRVKQAFQKVKDAMTDDLPVNMIDSAVEEMYDVIAQEEGDISTTFEHLQLVLDIQATGIILHLLKDDKLSATVLAGEFAEQIDDFKNLAFLNDDERHSLELRIVDLLKRVGRYISQSGTSAPVRTPECKCLLCRRAKATVTNSHIVSRFLVQQYFNLDKSNRRDIEAVESWNLQSHENMTHFGTDSPSEIFEKVLGHKPIKAEIDEYVKTRSLARDYILCPDCEKRLGVIESLYSDIVRNPKKAYNPAIPYLFWLSIFWRMSVVGMGYKLEPSHEEKLRKILDKALAFDKKDVVTDIKKLGHCAYILTKATDTRDETLGVFGHHKPMIPYVFIIGDMVINFYPTVNTARSRFKSLGRDLSLINDGTHPEVVQSLSFIDFWLAKRTIFDTNNRFHANWIRTDDITDYCVAMTDDDRKELYGQDGMVFDQLCPPVPDCWKMAMPRSIQKIRNYFAEHPDSKTKEELLDAIGYTEEEIAVMISYADANIKPNRV